MAPLNPDRDVPTYPSSDKTINPTDWLILSVLGLGRRQSRTNLSRLLGKETGYVSQRITELLNRELISRVGPGERSGLYELEPSGYAALRGADEPTHDERTRPNGRLLHMTPQMYDIVEALAEEPLLVTETRRILDSPEELDKTIIDSLQHYGLIESVSISVTRQFSGSSRESTERKEPGFVLSRLGELVVENKDVWVSSGNPALTDVVTGGTSLD